MLPFETLDVVRDVHGPRATSSPTPVGSERYIQFRSPSLA
jgi:hypothetical protein